MHMKKVNLDTWIQLLGMAGIIVSLIFVAMQMRQSHQFALASQQQARMEVFTELMNSLTESNIGFSDFLRAEITSEASAAAENWRHSILWIFENDYLQYSLGLMDDSIWNAKLNRLRIILSDCDAKEIFELRKAGLRQEFVQLVETFPEECI